MNKNKQRTSGLPLYTLRIVAALYILYQGYLLMKELPKNETGNKAIIISALVLFTLFGGILLIHSVYHAIKEYRQKSDKADEDIEIVEEDSEFIPSDEKEENSKLADEQDDVVEGMDEVTDENKDKQ